MPAMRCRPEHPDSTLSPRERRTGIVLFVVLVLLVLGFFALVLFATVAHAGTVYLYDPSVNIRGAATFRKRVNRGLRGTGLTMSVFPSFLKLQKALASAQPDLLMLPPFLAGKLQNLTLRPLLIRERRRSVVYEVVIVGRGTIEALSGKTLACAGIARETGFLNGVVLAGTGLSTGSVRVLSLGKDIDAVMAAGKGAVAGACTSPRSLELVQRANPAIGKALKVLRRVEGIPDTVVYATGAVAGRSEARWVRKLSALHKRRAGRKVLKLLRADRLVPVDARIKEMLP